MESTNRHLEGPGEISYDYKYDTLVFKMNNRNYKHSFEFQNFIADIDDKNFITGIRILDASKIFDTNKLVLKGIIKGGFKSRSEHNMVTITFKFITKIRNRIFPILSEKENFTQQITENAPIKMPDSLVEAPLVPVVV
ncbi:DUF2283 domain-containing protein [Candidatus Woesearchaeota archaeon]|nr:DUF2283 domain-containing protein [Candidatus Woesearchaeota archaeon]